MATERGGCHPPPPHRGNGRGRVGLVVGWAEPPAGSTVRPSVSPVTTPVASTGGVCPSLAGGSRPADVIAGLPISQSWYTLPGGSAGSPVVTTASSCRSAASTTVATPPWVTG